MSGAMYGYQDDSPQSVGNGLVFGLNAGTVKMTKFEWSNNAGKEDAEMEALVVNFLVDGADRALVLKKFPVVKAYGPNNEEITDSGHPVFKKAVTEFNAIITHIMHVFVDPDVIKRAFVAPVSSFKEYCAIMQSLLPKDYNQIPLDLFAQYQWNIGETANKTYLELPKKMSYGRWLCKAVEPVGKWIEIRKTNPSDSDLTALKYVDEANNIHPFRRTGWFVNHAFATQQSTESASDNVADKWQQQNTQPENPLAGFPMGEGDAATDIPDETTTW